MINPTQGIELKLEAVAKATKGIAAEASTLGSMILDWDCAVDVTSIIQPEDFYDCFMRAIATKLWAMYESGIDSIDLVLVRDELTPQELEAVGGVDMLVKVADSVPASTNAKHYAKIVKKNSRLMQIVSCTEQLARQSVDATDPDKMLAAIAEAVDGLSDVDEDGIMSFKDALFSTVTAAPEVPIKTGFGEIDEMSPVLPTDYIVIGARPGVGKTAFGLECAVNIAQEYGHTLFFSAEMSHQRVTRRVMQYNAGQGWEDSAEHQNDLASLPLTIIDKSYLTTRLIYNTIKKKQRAEDVKAVFIDHFHLLTDSGKKTGEYSELTYRSKELRLMAKALGVPLFVLCQLNRQAAEQRPRMSELRGTGAIEQDATAIWLLHREDEDHKFENDYEPNGEAHVYVDKNRDGMTGRVTLTFCDTVFTFKNKY